MDQMYYNFVKDVKNKLHEEINGRIIYEVYPEVDVCVFKVTFKDFTFAFPVDRVKARWIEEGKEGIIDIVNAFKTAYKDAIMNGFFKTQERKERDRKLRGRSFFIDFEEE